MILRFGEHCEHHVFNEANAGFGLQLVSSLRVRLKMMELIKSQPSRSCGESHWTDSLCAVLSGRCAGVVGVGTGLVPLLSDMELPF